MEMVEEQTNTKDVSVDKLRWWGLIKDGHIFSDNLLNNNRLYNFKTPEPNNYKSAVITFTTILLILFNNSGKTFHWK